MKPIKEVTPQEAKELLRNGWKLVDVRTKAEFDSGHVEEAIHLVLEDCTADSLKKLGGSKFAIICQVGGRSFRVCQRVNTDNSIEVVNVAGGTIAWLQSL